MIRRIYFKFRHMGILPKLLTSFLIVSVLPLIILGYLANENLIDTGFQAAQKAEEMGRMNMTAARDIGRTSIQDSVHALDRKSTESIELRTVELAKTIAGFLYERDKDILVLASLDPDPGRYVGIGSASKRDIVVPEAQRSQRRKPSDLKSRNPENKEEWRHTPPDAFPRVSRPLYREITFVDLEGREKIKIIDGKISDNLLDVSRKQNTYCRAEDYFSYLGRLKAGEIYVSGVIGEYVKGWLYETPEGLKVRPGSAYAGKENPKGKKFRGIIRWASPVFDKAGKKTGYVTMALDHSHLADLTDHVMPTEERFTLHPDGGSGNYAFIWDNRDRCISHARHFFICGYDPETGREIPGWISQETYDRYKKSGLTLEQFVNRLPSRRNFSQKKSGSAEQIRSGEIPLDCRILDTAPQCEGWHEGTEDGGSGSFLILWSGVWKLTTYAAIPYYTGAYGQSKRGFGYVTIGANVDDFHKDANIARAKIEESIFQQGNTILSTNISTREFIRERVARNRKVITVIALVAGLTVIGTSVILSLNITTPLRRLTDGATELSKGNYEQTITVKSRDEIGKLAKSFNDMAKAISEVDKMKSDFVTIASHELRTPIQAMLLGVSGILDGYSGPIDEEVREDLMLARAGIERLMRLVNDLLDISRIEARKFELNPIRTTPAGIINDAVEEISELAETHGHTIIIDMPAGVPDIEVDRDRMIQVIINLLSNAIKYSPDKGKILVTVRNTENEVTIRVVDNGYGVPEWAKEEIFKKFFQADSIMSQKVGGTGLGLTITRGIVEKLGGSVVCESPIREGEFTDLPLGGERKGSVFTIRLPINASTGD